MSESLPLPQQATDTKPSSEQEAVASVRNAVESVLQTNPAWSGSYFEFYAGTLSTFPDKITRDISPDVFSNRCGTASTDLNRILSQKHHLQSAVVRAQTEGVEPFDHFYIIISQGGHEVIVDTTIGQYVYGHSHTYVGTRETLRMLITSQTGEDKPYTLSPAFSGQSTEDVFDKVWGKESKKAEVVIDYEGNHWLV